MKTSFTRGFRSSTGIACALLVGIAATALANPVGPTVSQGHASFSTSGSTLTVQTSDTAFINWQSFNIALGQTTTFDQPSADSIVWNQIHGNSPSQILGNLNANGYVVLQNSSGFFIGGQAAITAHGLVMTTAPIPVPDLAGGGSWSFGTPPPTASIINYGQVNLSKGGSLYLIADNIANHGTLSAPGGDIGLYAGKQVLVSRQPDGLGLTAKVTLPAGSVDNDGRIIADAGTIEMNAQVVNQGGLVQANSIAEVNGVIQLLASDAVNLGANSTISAQGGSQGVSHGGNVLIKSGGSYSDQASSVINISGGVQGGNGGKAEISAISLPGINSQIVGTAASGYLGGGLVIDPLNILLTSSGSSIPGSGMVNPGDSPASGTLTLNVNTLPTGLSQITLEAQNNIELSTGWTLPAASTASTLTLQAGNSIILDDQSYISAGRTGASACSPAPATGPPPHPPVRSRFY